MDSIVGHKISDFFKAHIHMGSGGTFSDYPDFFALSVTLVLTGTFILVANKNNKHGNYSSVPWTTHFFLQIIFLDIFSCSGSRRERIVNSEQHFYRSKSVSCSLCCNMRSI